MADSANIFYLLRHLGDLKHLALGQWISVVGSAITAFGIATASDPHRLDVAVTAAAGTLVVAIVHVLQQSPIREPRLVAPQVDKSDRVHL